MNLDLQLVRYNYSGIDGGNELEYNELLVNLGFGEHVTTTLGWSNDVFGSGDSGLYLGLGGNYPLSEKLSLTGGIGRYALPADADYFDWNVGLAWDASPATLALQFIGTDGDARRNFDKIADNRIVGSVTFSF